MKENGNDFYRHFFYVNPLNAKLKCLFLQEIPIANNWMARMTKIVGRSEKLVALFKCTQLDAIDAKKAIANRVFALSIRKET